MLAAPVHRIDGAMAERVAVDSFPLLTVSLALWYVGIPATCFSGTGYGAKYKGRIGEPWLFHCHQTTMIFEL